MTSSQITQIINSVNSSPSSIFSKEDVIKIIGLVETECTKNNQGIITREDFEKFIDRLRDIKGEVYNMEVSENDVEFSLDGHYISVGHVEISGKDDVEEKIDELVDDMENLLIYPELRKNEVGVLENC